MKTESAKHTPGPWKMYPVISPEKKTNGYVAHVVTDREYPGGVCVANVHAESIFKSETEANARLIAAAPELYEALGRVAAYLAIHDPQYWESNADAIEARAAIAKADGEGVK